jgi:hypothetical protein
MSILRNISSARHGVPLPRASEQDRERAIWQEPSAVARRLVGHCHGE